MSVDGVSVPVILIAIGAIFILSAFGISVFRDSVGDPQVPTALRIALGAIGVLLLGTGVYFYVTRGDGTGGDTSPPTRSPAATIQAPAPSPSPEPNPLPSVGPDCGMVVVPVDLVTKAGPALKVGATIALTGPDPAQGDGRAMWVFTEESGSWYPWMAAIDRKGGSFYVQGVPLGRPDHKEDANIGVRTLHVLLLDPARDKALRKDLEANYRALTAAPEGATDLYTVPLDRVCTPK